MTQVMARRAISPHDDSTSMNATALSAFSMQPADLPRPRLSRNAAIALGVVALHAGLIWALQSGLLLRTAQLIVPVEVLAQLIELPEPKAEPAPPAPPAPPVRPVTPSVQKKVVPKPAARPQAQPLAIADPTPSPNAPTGSLAPAVASTPTAAPEAPAAPAPAAVQLPSSNADYLQNPKPAYPPLSKRLGEQGKVVVRVLIGADGVPQKAELRQSSGFDRLDQAALATVLKWRYVPGKRGGVAEDMWFNVPINFVLE
ncbi:outer membrane transport energization protein TonB [Polaromonas naphthalenivorans CJ2]|uniref:Outer membrane transport energization protein TonB n=2 Tax=Polaromonas naphthalenivorans TaxID=216465 RepID=A1VQE3_POLNA|nr:outer membrane transport energization protein TonB [Polaromonas naphthalenivorans CJ2]